MPPPDAPKPYPDSVLAAVAGALRERFVGALNDHNLHTGPVVVSVSNDLTHADIASIALYDGDYGRIANGTVQAENHNNTWHITGTGPLAGIAIDVPTMNLLPRIRSGAAAPGAAVAIHPSRGNIYQYVDVRGIAGPDVANTYIVTFHLHQPADIALIKRYFNEETHASWQVFPVADSSRPASPDLSPPAPLGTATNGTFAPDGDGLYGSAFIQLAPGVQPFTRKDVTVHILAHIASDALRVPVSALAGDAVFVIDSQHVAHRVPITIGARGEDFVQVTSGLAPTDLIAADAANLQDGDPVTLLPATQPAQPRAP